MESHHIFGYSDTGMVDTSSNSHPNVTGIPYKLFDRIKVEVGNSPVSAFSSQFDSESIASSHESKEQQSSTETQMRRSSPSSDSLMETSNYIHRFRPSVAVCGGRQLPSAAGGFSTMQDAFSCQKITYTLQELESALTAPDGDEEAHTTNTSFGGPHTPDMGPRAWNQEFQQTL